MGKSNDEDDGIGRLDPRSTDTLDKTIMTKR